MSRVVARVGKPHGIRGEVTVALRTDDLAGRLAVGTRLGVEPASNSAAGAAPQRELTVRSVREHKSTWLVAFDGVADRSAAEALRGALLVAPGGAEHSGDVNDSDTDDRDGDDEGWYEDELLGLAVEAVDGTRIGTVCGLTLAPAQDLLEVALVGGHTASIPFVEALVPVVDVAGGRVVVDPPAGLLELNA